MSGGAGKRRYVTAPVQVRPWFPRLYDTLKPLLPYDHSPYVVMAEITGLTRSRCQQITHEQRKLLAGAGGGEAPAPAGSDGDEDYGDDW